MERIKAMPNHDGLCWKCLQSFDKSKIHNINIPKMGYGSGFDSWSTEIHLCDKCYNESIKDNKELWDMKEIPCRNKDCADHGCTEYKYEEEMFEYIDKLNIVGQQFVKNEFAKQSMYPMDSQDWIDYELGVLPHEKCKEYGMYSQQEIDEYNEKFSTCEYVVNRIWFDNSKNSYCPFGASGYYNQQCNYNISTECDRCKYYLKRITPIKDIQNKDFNDYMEYLRLKIRQEELKNKFE
jgi:hypothetical protein